MRFLADVGLSPRIVEWLRTEGHDAIHLQEQHLERLADPAIFRKAIEEQRTLLTFDLDFAEIVALSQGGEASVVLFRLKNTRPAFVLSRLATVLAESGHLLRAGVIITLEDSRHRIRRLPIEGQAEP
jgi:predicted nuclease of predicted toxin-antitoxin system